MRDHPPAMTPEQLADAYRHLVRTTLARRFQGLPPHLDPEDLVAAGNLGLWLAAQRFDPQRGAAFRSYAITCIYGAMRNHLRNDDWVPRAERQKIARGEAEAIALISLEEARDENGRPMAEGIPSDRPGPEELLMQAEDAADRDHAARWWAGLLDQLDPHLRLAVEITIIRNGGHSDLRERAGICDATAYRRCREARDRLRQLAQENPMTTRTNPPGAAK